MNIVRGHRQSTNEFGRSTAILASLSFFTKLRFQNSIDQAFDFTLFELEESQSNNVEQQTKTSVKSTFCLAT